MYRIMRLFERFKAFPRRDFSAKKGSPPAKETEENVYRFPTLNDLPPLRPNFAKEHGKIQSFYNMILVGGIGSLIASIAAGKIFLELYNDIPDEPAEIDCYKDLGADVCADVK